jgi:hypothetical protein
MNFFYRDLNNIDKLKDAAPDIYLNNRMLFTRREPIVIKASEMHKLLSVPRNLFKNILYYHGNFYVSPINEPRYKFIGLTRQNSIPICVFRSNSKNHNIILPYFEPIIPKIPRLEILCFYQLTTWETEQFKHLIF